MVTESIQLALIASTRDTPHYSRWGDIDLAFAHLCLLDQAYCAYFADRSAQGVEVILDNGIMELGHTVSEADLADVARAVQPALITPPEVLGDGPETTALTIDFIQRWSDLEIPDCTQVLGVVHGQDWSSWLETYRYFHDALPAVARIGIPYDMQFEVPGVSREEALNDMHWMVLNRIRAVELLHEEGLSDKAAHLLGCIDAIELLSQSRFDFVVSNDSSTVFVTTQRGERYHPERGIGFNKHKIDMAVGMPLGREDLFQSNLKIVRQLARRPSN